VLPCLSLALFGDCIANYYVLCIFILHFFFIIFFLNADFAVSTFYAVHYTIHTDQACGSYYSNKENCTLFLRICVTGLMFIDIERNV